MTITVSNGVGGQKIGESPYTYGGASYAFQPQTFTSDKATKQARFQFDLARPTHCLLENDVADVIDRKTKNCTVFPITLDEDITSVSLHIFYVVEPYINGIVYISFLTVCKLVHGQVTIIFVVSVGLFVQSFSQPSLIRFQTRTYVIYLGLVVSPRI